MQHLTRLFKFLEITRAQPQYGYVLANIPKSELSDLAQHHYLVTFFGWQLARLLNRKGAKINVEKVLAYCLVHDLGELLGGDISMPYGRVNPKAKKLARAFEYENIKYISKFFGQDEAYIRGLGLEVNEFKNDESIIAMISDVIECTHYKIYKNRFIPLDVKMAKEKIEKHISRLKDKAAKRELNEFLKKWYKELPKNNQLDKLLI